MKPKRRGKTQSLSRYPRRGGHKSDPQGHSEACGFEDRQIINHPTTELSSTLYT